MKKSDDIERLAISLIKQYVYCKRRFALMFIDDQWDSNYKTIEGDIFHEKVNDPFFNEKRGDRYISRSVPIFSEKLNLYGIADAVEFLQDENGVKVDRKRGLWRINPIEYKNGKQEKSDADNYQLCAQAMCLEEMFSTEINSGDIYYGKLRKRVTIELTNGFKQKTADIIREINELVADENPLIPPKPENQICNLCSLADICVPAIFDNTETNSARINRFLKAR